MPLYPSFIVEFYTPDEIIESRRSFNAKNVAGAQLAARHWLARGADPLQASRCRIIDQDGKTILDKPLAEFF